MDSARGPMSESRNSPEPDPAPVPLVNVRELAAKESLEATCLRPLGLCELSGSCDVCWYRPDHPRFQKE